MVQVCTDNTKREARLIKLIKELIGKDSHLFGLALATCIDYHLKDLKNIIDQFPINKHLNRHQELIQEVLLEQQQIGWRHMLHGFLATSWHMLASIHHTEIHRSDNSRGNQSIQQAIQYIHKFTRGIWLGCNAALHEHQDTADAKICTAESAEIRHYHDNPLLLPQHDRHYCMTPLTKLLQSKPTARRRWLRRVRLARATYVIEGRSQQTLTRYITIDPRIPTIRNHNPVSTTTLLHNSTAKARNKTTQQRLTEFFTGRPPDRNKTIGNPSLTENYPSLTEN